MIFNRRNKRDLEYCLNRTESLYDRVAELEASQTKVAELEKKIKQLECDHDDYQPDYGKLILGTARAYEKLCSNCGKDLGFLSALDVKAEKLEWHKKQVERLGGEK